MAEGNGNGNVRITGTILLSVVGALLFAWGAWMTNAVLDEQHDRAVFKLDITDRVATARTEALDAHRRIDGVARAMGCPYPRTTLPKETP